MKKFLAILVTAVLAVTACMGLTACGAKKVGESGKIVVGVTDYAPMDYIENGKWVGFDAELSEKVFTDLGYEVEFKEIDWDTKIVTLNSGNIDVIWNGMTVTDELLNNVLLSNVYLQNQQYAVVKMDSTISAKADLTGKKVAVESGSAAEDAMEGINCTLNKLSNQNAAVMEVAAGTSDVAIVDYTMALTLTTSASSEYTGVLKMVDLGFEVEEFAIAFRQADSKLCFNVNKKIDELKKSGYIETLAIKYGIENLLII